MRMWCIWIGILFNHLSMRVMCMCCRDTVDMVDMIDVNSFTWMREIIDGNVHCTCCVISHECNYFFSLCISEDTIVTAMVVLLGGWCVCVAGYDRVMNPSQRAYNILYHIGWAEGCVCVWPLWSSVSPVCW